MSRTQSLVALMVALVIAGGALAYIASGGLAENLVYYLDVQEMQARKDELIHKTVRLGGVVQHDSVRPAHNGQPLQFDLGLAPSGGVVVAVQARGQMPQMFQPGIGAVVEGQFDGQKFVAQRVMVKHSNEYRPPAPGEHPKEVFKTLVPADAPS